MLLREKAYGAAYLSAKEYQEEQTRLAGNRTGFGLSVTVKDADLLVMTVDEGSPAALAGIVKGDRITAVDGEAVTGTAHTEVEQKIATLEKLILTVVHDGAPTAVELTANTYTYISVSGRLLDGNVGYIRIREFNNVTPLQFKNVYNDLTQQCATYFMCDVRNNAGGQSAAVQEILDYLLPRGPYANCKKKGETIALTATDTYEMTAPTVTLVNANTVGEAELFAAVLQDMSKTRLIGTTTEGKAVMQEYATIQSDKGAVRLTVGTLYRIHGDTTWADSGLIPNQLVDLSFDKLTYFELLTDEEDDQLQAGLEVFKNGAFLSAVTEPTTTTTTTVAP